jgi:hypothetical protein
MKNFKTFLQYLNDHSIEFTFRQVTKEIVIKRHLINFELNKSATNNGLSLFELDNIIIFY